MHSAIVQKLLFDFMSYENTEAMAVEARTLPNKWLRWLATHHPDNRSRKLFLRLSHVSIGSGTVVNSGFIVSDNYEPLLTIGERVAISPNVVVICASSPNNSQLSEIPGFTEKYIKSLPVAIGDDTWIGTGAIILPGVKIGRKAIIGAGSIIVKDVTDGMIVAGNPMRLINTLSISLSIQQLQKP